MAKAMLHSLDRDGTHQADLVEVEILEEVEILVEEVVILAVVEILEEEIMKIKEVKEMGKLKVDFILILITKIQQCQKIK